MDSWIVLAWSPKNRMFSYLDLWIVPTWSLKNKEGFRIELIDRSDFLFRITPHRVLKPGVFQNGPKCFV